MRLAIVLLFVVGLGLSGWRVAHAAGESPAPDLQAIYDSHDWFRLREAIAGKEASALYRGAVAAAFNRSEEAAEALHPLINGTVSSKDADDADDWLSYLFVRNGQYQRAAAEMDEGTPLLAMLRTLPDQSVAKSAPSTIACRLLQQRLFIPLTIGRTAAEFFVDSDANFSFMSESEAKSLGLTIQESGLTVHGAGGIQTGFRTAVAEELTVGNVELRHVAFMVMPDSEAAFAHLSQSQQGAIGLPVLLAFRTVHYRPGMLDIASSPIVSGPVEQNLCFDGLDPVTRVSFEQQQLPVVLDTGASRTEIWPPFARQFTAVADSPGRSSNGVENSFGGKSLIPEKILPQLLLGWGGCDLRLRSVRLLLATTTPNSNRYYGRLGLDGFVAMHEVSIDFEALHLTAQ